MACLIAYRSRITCGCQRQSKVITAKIAALCKQDVAIPNRYTSAREAVTECYDTNSATGQVPPMTWSCSGHTACQQGQLL